MIMATHYALTCDATGCAEGTDPRSTLLRGIDFHTLAREASELGWRHIGDGMWHCPHHAGTASPGCIDG